MDLILWKKSYINVYLRAQIVKYPYTSIQLPSPQPPEYTFKYTLYIHLWLYLTAYDPPKI